MEQREFIALFISQSQTILSLWSIYGVISITLIGLIVQRKWGLSYGEKFIFIVGFLAFSITNNYPLYLAMVSQEWLADQINLAAFQAINMVGALITHIVYDIIVLSTILFFNNNKKAT